MEPRGASLSFHQALFPPATLSLLPDPKRRGLNSFFPLCWSRLFRANWLLEGLRGVDPHSPGLLFPPTSCRSPPGHAQSAQVRMVEGGGGSGRGAGARAELRNRLSCAPTGGRSRAHKLPAAERLFVPLAAPVPTGCGRRQDAPPADVDPRCDSGTAAPSSSRRDSQSLPASPLPKPQGWKMWQPATERLQVRGTRETGGQPGRGGAGLKKPR